MDRVTIVTDSTADLPPAVTKELGIEVVPLTVHFGDEAFLDQIELTSEEFYGRLTESPVLPRTSQPSPGQFENVYRRLAGQTDTIISVHISGELSGTLQSAAIAAEAVSDRVPVHFVDSRSASLGLGMAVLEAARPAARGADLATCLERLEAAIDGDRNRVFFVVKTLEYLHKNGRIGRAARFVGSVLSLCPVLTLADGIVTPSEKVRGFKRAVGRMTDRVLETVEKNGAGSVKLGICHADNGETAEAIGETLDGVAGEVTVSQLSPVLGSHAGPQAVGICLLINDS